MLPAWLAGSLLPSARPPVSLILLPSPGFLGGGLPLLPNPPPQTWGGFPFNLLYTRPGLTLGALLNTLLLIHQKPLAAARGAHGRSPPPRRPGGLQFSGKMRSLRGSHFLSRRKGGGWGGFGVGMELLWFLWQPIEVSSSLQN